MARKNTYQRAATISITLFCLVCTNVLSSRAQVLTSLNNKLADYQRSILHEKLYVHINKGIYMTGEVLWFKIYNTDGSNGKLIDISKVAYVELLDNNHVAVLQTKVGLKDGTGSGSLYIPFSLNTGNYRLKAYTSWMKNFDAAYFFESEVTVVNPLKASPLPVKPVTPLYDIQFFPEGGHLVKNVTSTVAFKITGAGGKGEACTGVVINQKNDTVAHFRSLKFGIGRFFFRPSGQDVYKAMIKTGNTVMVKELPVISASGYVMHAADAGERWEIGIKNLDSTLSTAIYLIAHSNRPVQFAAGAKLANGSAHFTIDKNKLADGVNYITLFDDQQRPLCERLIFKRPAKKLVIDAGTDSRVYTTRKKVNLAVSSREQNSGGVAAELSVSVFRTDALQNETNEHIGGYLWLRSDLKGYIESPDYYLDNNTPEADEAADNLMLSQGWSQFDWDNVLSGNTPRFKFLPEYTGPVISARITNTLNNAPAKNIMAYLTIPGPPNNLYVARSDSAGQLFFNTENFYGLHEMVLQTNRLQDSTYRIEVISPFSEQSPATATSPALAINEALKDALVDNSVNMQVQNIFAANHLKQFYNGNTDSVSFYGFPTKTYLLDNYTRFTTIEEVLREYVTSIGVSKRQGKFNVRMYNGDQPLGSPLILLDGVPVFDADKMFKFDPLKVKRLDVVSANYRYGPAFFNGIMSFTTYKGDGVTYEIDPRALVVDYEGLQQERRFYSPVYDSDALINSPVPDFRTALYWDPALRTNADGKAGVLFYTGDKPGRYIGVIEGISVNGSAGSQRFYFEVKK